MARLNSSYTQGTITEDAYGITAEQSYQVLDLDTNLYDALSVPGMPAIGSAHPEIPGIVALRRKPRYQSDRSAIVSIEYGKQTPENSPQLGSQRTTIDASIIQEKTYFDINGTRISVAYGSNPVITQYPSATLATNLVTLTIVTRETTSEANLILRAIDYVEHVNDAIWFGWPAETWKVDDIQVRPTDQDQYREVSHVLTYRPDTWRFLATFIDAGRVPPDATEGAGFQRFEVKQPADFNGLPITVPTMPP